ncbi:MAG: cytidine deaminase [Oligoflexia bacterium]|nr:cytidine deaminase [Oligoflexia bacterium]
MSAQKKTALPAGFEELWKAATAARNHSHSPYSKAKVGAAIRTTDGRVFAGCNVENASYGGTVCAERGAVQTAVAALGKIQLKEVLVITDATPPWPPCGFCRQVIAEFATEETLVHACNTQGECKTLPFSELFPNAFTPTHLEK